MDWGWSKALDHQAMNLCFLAEEEGTLYVRCDVEVFGEWRTTLGVHFFALDWAELITIAR